MHLLLEVRLRSQSSWQKNRAKVDGVAINKDLKNYQNQETH